MNPGNETIEVLEDIFHWDSAHVDWEWRFEGSGEGRRLRGHICWWSADRLWARTLLLVD